MTNVNAAVDEYGKDDHSASSRPFESEQDSFKTASRTLCKCFGSLSLLAMVAAGCGAAPDSGAESGSVTESGPVPGADDAVSEVKSKLGAVICQGSFNHGGNASPQTLSATVSCPLAPGFHRMTARASNTGAGSCGVASWTDRNNVHDASFNLYIINDGGFSNGTCSYFATEDSDPPAHPLCVTGVALSPVSTSCAASICARDSFCCTNAWDSICVGEVQSICRSLTCAQNTACSHAECSTGPALTFNCSSAVSFVCANDPACCLSTWDSTCVSLVSSLSTFNCGP